MKVHLQAFYLGYFMLLSQYTESQLCTSHWFATQSVVPDTENNCPCENTVDSYFLKKTADMCLGLFFG